jgi:periplasmic mercuric ion binding protein
MKKFFILVFMFVCFHAITMAQTPAKPKPVVSAVIKTPTALCESCKTRIEAYLKRYDGVLEINVNFKKGETKVKYITDRTDIEQIKAAIANCGYDADDVTPTADIYNRLPITCKKPEDGGGHPKPKPKPAPVQASAQQ